MRRTILIAGIVCVATVSSRAYAGPASEGPRLGVPVDCAIGTACIVQNYVDHDPGPGARDHTCGTLAYDGHDGIDIRVPGLVEMRAGVPVLAAASGTVRTTRDGMADVSIRVTGPQAVAGRETGNAVVIDHGDGWETQYSHLRRGSVAVRRGEAVAAGTVLGLIGLSGRTEFPHVHFAVRHRGKTLDPYTGRTPGRGCAAPGRSLWTAEARARLAYRASGALSAGFAGGTPEIDDALAGAYRMSTLPEDAPALVFWVVAWGLRTGDREEIRIVGPDGRVFAEDSAVMPGNKAQWLRYAGRRRRDAAFAPGLYRGAYRVFRSVADAERRIVEISREIEVRRAPSP